MLPAFKELILSDYKPINTKDSDSILREFECDKWGRLLHELNTTPNLQLRDLELREDGCQDKYLFLDHKHYIAPPNFLRIFIKTNLVSNFLDLNQRFNFSAVAEYGCGYGSKLLELAVSNKNSGLSKLQYYGFDVSQSGLDIAKKLSKFMGINIHCFKTKVCSELNIPSEIPKPYFLFSSYGLHYHKSLQTSMISKWIDSGCVAGIHFEPCFELLDKIDDVLYREFARKYHRQQDYTENIFSCFEDCHDKGLIEFKVEPSICGFGLLPGRILRWNVANA